MIPFLLAAIAMTIAAVALIVLPLVRARPGAPSTVSAVVAAVAIPATVTLLYAALGTFPGRGAPGSAASAADTQEIETLKAEVARAPDDAAGWLRLGDAYVAAERYADAKEAYGTAMERDRSGNDDIRLAFAEASILVDRSAVNGDAGRIVDEVIARNPANPKALWYGGMVSLARGDTAGARTRWSRLLELGPPQQVRDILTQQIAALDGAGETPAAPSATAAAIPVRVSLRAELAAKVRPGAALFLIARAPGAAGPPLAVVRRNSPTLPLDLEISDADSMVPGRTMSGLAEVQLTARLANDGEALPAPGDVFGEATWMPGATSKGPLEITMDRVVE